MTKAHPDSIVVQEIWDHHTATVFFEAQPNVCKADISSLVDTTNALTTTDKTSLFSAINTLGSTAILDDVN